MTGNVNSLAASKSRWTLKDTLAPFVAIAALLAFAWFVIYMLGLTKVQEPEWTRTVYLFTGVEAIAFAAAGFLFGREVHRKQAKNAENRAFAAEKHAVDAQIRASEAETRGKAMAEAIKVKVKGYRSKVTPYSALGVDKAVEATQTDFNELVDLAKRLFSEK